MPRDGRNGSRVTPSGVAPRGRALIGSFPLFPAPSLSPTAQAEWECTLSQIVCRAHVFDGLAWFVPTTGTRIINVSTETRNRPSLFSVSRYNMVLMTNKNLLTVREQVAEVADLVNEAHVCKDPVSFSISEDISSAEIC